MTDIVILHPGHSPSGPRGPLRGRGCGVSRPVNEGPGGAGAIASGITSKPRNPALFLQGLLEALLASQHAEACLRRSRRAQHPEVPAGAGISGAIGGRHFHVGFDGMTPRCASPGIGGGKPR